MSKMFEVRNEIRSSLKDLNMEIKAFKKARSKDLRKSFCIERKMPSYWGESYLDYISSNLSPLKAQARELHVTIALLRGVPYNRIETNPRVPFTEDQLERLISPYRELREVENAN